MSTRLHVFVRFGILYTDVLHLAIVDRIRDEGVESDKGCTLEVVEGEDQDPPQAMLYVQAAAENLLDMEEHPIRAVTPIPDGADPRHAPYCESLRAFCKAHTLPWREPDWHVVAERW